MRAPAIEAVFTVQEETSMGGALALDKDAVRSRRFISLDCGGGNEMCIRDSR